MIRVEGISKRFGDHVVLTDATFEAPAGQVTAFLGPNGAGKTTTMRILSTLLRPDSGDAFIMGASVATCPVEVRRIIGLVTEEPGLRGALTPREQLTFFGRAYGLSTSEVATNLSKYVDLLGLGPHMDKKAGELSKGNRQKVALARALLHEPPVLLLDEPTANLDILAQEAIQSMLETDDLVAGRTVLLSTHVIEEAERLASNVVGIAGGRVVVNATKEEVVAQASGDTFRQAFLALVGATALGET